MINEEIFVLVCVLSSILFVFPFGTCVCFTVVVVGSCGGVGLCVPELGTQQCTTFKRVLCYNLGSL